MKLPIVAAERFHVVNIIAANSIRMSGNTECVRNVRLGQFVLFSEVLCDIAVGFGYRHVRTQCSDSANQRFSHDAHECSVSVIATLFQFADINFAFVDAFVACFTEGNQVSWPIASGLPGFQVMNMKLHIFICAAVSAFITVTVQHILTDVIIIMLFTELVICSDRQRFAFFHRFQVLQVKLSSLNTNTVNG